MDCLKGIIGINSNVGTATSGLYITDLPDISLAKLSRLTDEDSDDITLLFEEIEKRSVLKFVTLFTIEINRCWKISNREKIQCLICENVTLLSVALWYLMGSEVINEQINSPRLNKYTTVDKGKAKELYAQFYEDFISELHIAVSGIDISASACFAEEEIDSKDIISVIYTTP